VESIAVAAAFVAAGSGILAVLAFLLPFSLGPLVGIAIGVSVDNTNAWVVLVLFALIAGGVPISTDSLCLRLVHCIFVICNAHHKGSHTICCQQSQCHGSHSHPALQHLRCAWCLTYCWHVLFPLARSQFTDVLRPWHPAVRAGLFIYVGSVGIVAEEFAKHDNPAFAATRPKVSCGLQA
jgi:hypothetical protein